MAQDIAQAGVLHGRLLQVAHGTGALHVRQRRHFFAERNMVGVLPVERITGQIEVCRQARVVTEHTFGTIQTHKAADSADQIIVANLTGTRGREIDGSDIALHQSFQFLSLGYSILVNIPPDPHIGEVFILGIEYTIAIAIQFA
ncbi:hypothetical protein D3C84_899700 [compost metagenome]